MVILPSHTSHDLPPSDVSCFKPFKTTLKKEKDGATIRNNHKKLNKVTLASWVNKVLNQVLSKKNIKIRFKVDIGIWPLNPKAMDENSALQKYTHHHL
jgi:hypothetical protein